MAKIKLSNNVKIARESLDIGLFVDTSNVLANQSDGQSINYTAAQDCIFFGHSGNKRYRIDNVDLTGADAALLDYTFFLKAGQNIQAANYNGWGGWRYKVFGIKS